MVHFVEEGGEDDRLAPITPMFERRSPLRAPGAGYDDDRVIAAASASEGDAAAPAGEDAARAEKALVRRLANRQLSVSEARAFLAGRDIGEEDVEAIIEDFLARRYLDDARLAEQLVYQGAERKGRGRQAIAQTMAARGIPRDDAEAALLPLADDEGERALDVARGRARLLDGVDEQAALRRLHGQLMRRGYSGSAAMEAARTALAERRAESSGVRFR
ncbi:regulatory protein RecX [Microbacter sp. GSS18]|nr:regulatory protein RecX [Microbacter sp. GSS18]